MFALFSIGVTGVIQAARVTPAQVYVEIDENQMAIQESIVDQILETAEFIGRKKGTPVLESEQRIEDLELAQKEAVIDGLSKQNKSMIFEIFGWKFLDLRNKSPFKVPSQCNLISQLDMFCLMISMLLHGDEYKKLREAFRSCIGDKQAWSIKGKLDHPEFDPLVPKSFKAKFYTSNPVAINQLRMIINERVKI